MKGNSSKFLALLLSASMIMSPTASVLADTQEKAAQTESSAAAEEAPQSEETAETAEPETTPAETESSESTAETPAEEPTETPAAPAEDQTPAGSDETETPSADEDASEDTAEDTAKDGEETADTTEKEPEAADETSQDAGKETPAKEETKDAVKENTSPAAEQPKTEVKETTKNEASNTAEKKETKVAEAAKPADGEYETSAEATGSMFRVISSRLIVKDGKLKASILLSGTGYDYLYTGTAAEAAAADEKSWIAPTGSETYTDTKTGAEKTGYRFEIPVEELDKQMDVAVRSAKKKTWADKTVTIHSTAAIPTVTPEPTEPPAPSETPGDDSSETPVSVEAPVVKDNGQAFKMFLISEATMINKGDKLVLTLKTNNTSFDKLYFGNNDDLAKAPVIQGMQEANDGFSFAFEVDADKAGTTVPIVLGKKDGTWYTKQQLYFVIPGTKTPDVTPTPEPTVTPEPTEIPAPTATPTPEPSKVPNGIYSGTAETGAQMFKVVAVELTVKDGDMKAKITLSGVAYDYLYMGTPEEAAAADKSAWIAGIGTADYTTDDGQTKTGMQYEIPVAALDQPLTVASHSEKRDKWYARTITIASASLKKTSDLPADETNKIADGIYEATAETGAAMFKVVKVKLTAKDGKMTALITLSGVGYNYLYLGTAADAAADESAWIASKGEGEYTLNGETKTGLQFEIPVEALDQGLAVAAHAVKSGKWFDRTITIASSSLKKTGDLPSDDSNDPKPTIVPTKTPTVSPSETPVVKPTSTPAPAPTQKPADTKPEQESKYESDLSGGTSKVDSATTLADGVYTPDGFSFSGGSGKVTISCSKITVTNGQAYATIAFSSPYYGYVKANGNKYMANVSGGSSIFTIPVELNKNNTIIGMTTRMSVAHEISYNIFISLAAAKKGGSTSFSTGFVKADGTTSTISTDNSKLDTTAPEIMGLEYKAETKLAYAEYFKMYHYDEGITLLEIDMTKDTERDPEKQTEDDKKAEDTDTAAAEDTAAATDEEEAAAASDSKKTSTEKAKDLTEKTKELYEGNVVKYLIVPKDVEIPAGLDKDMIVIQLPVEKTYVASEDALKLLDEQLDAAESIKAVGMEQKDCQIENIAKAMEDKKISFDGAFDDLDYKALVKDEIDFAILPSEFLPGNAKDEEDADAADETADTKSEDQKDDKDDKTTDEKADEDKTPEELLKEENERLSDTAERLATLTIPMLVDRSADEKTDLAKAEWLKVYGVIFGCEDQANELFQQMVKAEENK
ncbi:hypothetical protein LIZ62_11795 [Fusicatenibacter saccharivorans]|uniref:hypothetical protein n=1 Tax=Fusicatenibacter saccharivorans TaxID=1150298 RepID=UPI001D06A67D|nr:hypothetical protein [Fusicatenibacter saccharivorans]MCB7100916.1 hypothetical protein [Fusicatenibacter saccharivorans]